MRPKKWIYIKAVITGDTVSFSHTVVDAHNEAGALEKGRSHYACETTPASGDYVIRVYG